MSTWSNPIADYLNWLAAGGVAVETRRLRRYQLARVADRFADTTPWDITPNDLSAWMAEHDWSTETLRSYRSALRGFYGWAHSSGIITVDPARLLRKVTTPPPRPRPAPERVVNQALMVADERAWLMLMLGSRHGLRRGEIARVHTTDLADALDGDSELLVHGKGGKQRTIPILDEVAAAIRAAPAGWVFPNGQGSHLTPAHVGVILRRLLETGTTPHQLRHRFASRAYHATHDIRAVQELLGHASVATTQRYVAVADDALRKAVRAVA